MQTSIPCVLMRGGTSRGPYLLGEDLPADPKRRDAVLIALMGTPHALQVDGLGGGHPLTSKVAIVSRSARPGCDVDYLFAQVAVESASVDTKPNCGNMLAGVGPFAIEAGLVQAADPETVVRIHNVNTGARIDAAVQTPKGVVRYDGDTAIAGVPGTAAPIRLTFRDFIGTKSGRLFPGDGPMQSIDGIRATLIDSAMPMMLIAGQDFGIDAMPEPAVLEASVDRLRQIEGLRRKAGSLMGLGDVSNSVIPKVGILLPAETATVGVVYLTPHRVHQAVAVTGAICVATAARSEGTLASAIARPGGGEVVIAHPSGVIHIGLEQVNGETVGASVTRTARRLFEGRAFVPAHLFGGGQPSSPTGKTSEEAPC